MLSGRLKLGPKRKNSALHITHKLHPETNDLENQFPYPPLFDKSFLPHPHSQQQPQQSQTQTLHLFSPRNHSHQISTTSHLNLPQKMSTDSNVFQPSQQQRRQQKQLQQNRKQQEQLEEIKSKNEILEAQLTQIKNEKELLAEQLNSIQQSSAQEKQQLQLKITTLRQQKQSIQSQPSQQKDQKPCTDPTHLHYQNQLQKLKTEHEQLQIKSLQNSHLSLSLQTMVEQHNFQLQSKNEQIKKLQQNNNKLKLTISETTSQHQSKQHTLRQALLQSQNANKLLAHSLQELNQHLQTQQSSKHQTNKNVQHLTQQIQVLTARAQQNQNKGTALRKKYQLQISELNKKIINNQEQHHQKYQEAENIIHKLNHQKQKLKLQLAQATTLQNKTESLINKEEDGNKLITMKEEIQELSIDRTHKEQLIRELEIKLKEYFSPDQYRALERRCKELEEKRLSSARYYEEKLYNYQKQNDKLRLEKIETSTTQNNQPTTFDQVIKKTLEESEALRTELKRMTDALAHSKQQANQIRQKQKNYLNQLQILRKKSEASSKNSSIQRQIETQKYLNQIDSLKRKLTTSQTRLSYKINENKQKDEFIKSVIVGRIEPIDKQTVLTELERIFQERDKQQSQ